MFDLLGCAQDIQAEVERLWPDETIETRAMCLAEEAGETSRAITKRRHAMTYASGRCKGMTPEEWTEKLRQETMQTIGVALTICVVEGFDPVQGLQEVVHALQGREHDV